METILTPSIITFALGLLAVLFSVYNYFRDPQIRSDKKDALLAQQIQWQAEASDRRFKDMQESFQSLLLQSNNHIHTLDVKTDALNGSVGTLKNEITRLATIIEERVPKGAKT